MGFTNSKFSNGSESFNSPSGDMKTSSSNKVVNDKQNFLQHISNKFIIVWLDPTVNELDIIYRNSIARFRRISFYIHIFTNVNECIEYLSKTHDVKVLMIVAGAFVEEIWPRIKSMKHIHSIYIVANEEENKQYHEKEYEKVKGIFDRVDSIYGFLKRDTRHIEQDLLGISIIPSGEYTKQDLRQLNSLFLYWLLAKQIIMNMKYDEESHKNSIEFCRSHFTDDKQETKIINEYALSYHDHSPIWWYTRQCFLRTMLSRAIQTQDIEVIIKMAPFIQDLNRQIEEIEKNNDRSIILYRTQTTSNDDFEKLKSADGHFISYHNFVLADTNYKTALDDARRASRNVNAAVILFRIEVDDSRKSTCLTPLKTRCYSVEQENYFLFSMDCVFRIADIKQIENRIWQFTLKPTETNDKQLTCLKELIQDVTQNGNDWYKLAKLMVVMRDFDHAKEIYHVLLNLLPDSDLVKKCQIYNELGLICDETGDYRLALSFYLKALEIQRKTTRINHHILSVAYNNIGEVQRELGDYFKALSYHQRTLSIKQKILSPQDISLATTYNNLGLANQSLGEYSTALEFYEKSLDIKRKVLPPNHVDLAVTYNNIGELQREMGKFSAALKYFEKGLQIRLKTCSPYDISLAITYNNIGVIHKEQGDYNQAISYFRKSLEIKEKTYTTHHPSLAVSYINIGEVHYLLGEFSEAITMYEKALEIQEKSYSSNHPELAITYNNLGVVNEAFGRYPTALSFFQKSLKIRQKSLPPNHPTIATSYNNIGHIYQLMGDDNGALEYYQKTQKVQEKCFGSQHPMLAVTYNNLADVERKLNNHKKALLLYQKSLEIKKKSLSLNHPSLATSYNNIAVLYQVMQNHTSALEYYKKTLEIQQKTLPSQHPDIAFTYYNIGTAYNEIKEYSTAIENYERALQLHEKSLPSNHPTLAHVHNGIATASVYVGNFKKALEHEQRAVDISAETLAPDHPHLQTFRLHLQQIQSMVDGNPSPT